MSRTDSTSTTTTPATASDRPALRLVSGLATRLDLDRPRYAALEGMAHRVRILAPRFDPQLDRYVGTSMSANDLIELARAGTNLAYLAALSARDACEAMGIEIPDDIEELAHCRLPSVDEADRTTNDTTPLASGARSRGTGDDASSKDRTPPDRAA